MVVSRHTVLRVGEHIISAPEICGGSPVIAGTRVPVRVIAGWWRSGMTLDDIMDGYPHPRPEQITAALTDYFENRRAIDEETIANGEGRWQQELLAGEHPQ